MDKEWMKLPSPHPAYVKGVQAFIDFAFENIGGRTGEIPYPCNKCFNRIFQIRTIVREHLIIYGIMVDYTKWHLHGEASSSSAVHNEIQIDGVEVDHVEIGEMPDMVNELYWDRDNECRAKASKFEKYMNDANRPLHPECKTETTLSFIVWLFNLKCNAKWPDWSFDLLLGKLNILFPKGTKLPRNFYETKKMVGDLGFSYEKIDACKNDCILFWKEDGLLDKCKVCGESRWKTVPITHELDVVMTEKQKKISVKQLRYFPLIPRLQRLFYSSKTTEDMKWHHIKRRKDGVQRHLADSKAWKDFDTLHPNFSNDIRNVRLGLSTDGMNPFTYGASYSIWPVLIVVYNLPPWMCMKHHHFIMPLLIPGPTSPGNDIDVYLRPLIEELNTLWAGGVETYDVSSKSIFTMRAALLWTISDFPALATLNGWSTKGYLAYPTCQGDTCSHRLRNKICYIGHRRFLELNHKYRYDKRRFDGSMDLRKPPQVLSGYDILEKIEDIHVTFGKTSKNTVPHDSSHNWRKKSIFFELLYWRSLTLCYNLDVMHIEKNVCDNLIGILLGMSKSKDTLTARKDLEDMSIRSELHPIKIGSSGQKFQIPAACYALSRKEKQEFLRVLKNVKVPDGYASNILRCINVRECKISGLKSHDCHILIQQLLPIAIRCTPLPQHVKKAVIDLCHYCTKLWSSDYCEEDFARLSNQIPLVLCNLEMIFPPAFFDIMIHLPIHLAEEARIGGNVKFRNMYPFERYMYKVKRYIRNRSHPEGSIAEGVLAEECLNFCSKYLQDNDSTWNRSGRNEDGYEEGVGEYSFFKKVGRFVGTPSPIYKDINTKATAHTYVLFNCKSIEEIWERSYLMQQGRHRRPSTRDVDNARKKLFSDWFRKYAQDIELPVDIKALARGPSSVA